MKLLQKGNQGHDVIVLQRMLRNEQGIYHGAIDGIFGPNTERAVRLFQIRAGLREDGIVGNATWEAFTSSLVPKNYAKRSSPSAAKRKEMFGRFNYNTRLDKTISIQGDWVEKNIVEVHLPQLVGIEGFPPNGRIKWNKKAVNQLVSAFEEIDGDGLTDDILSWGGSFYPRLVRGSSVALSNHSYGSAFDINAPENWLGVEPARPGTKGSLYDLVPIFSKWGFAWGGDYKHRKDGMHFEVAELI